MGVVAVANPEAVRSYDTEHPLMTAQVAMGGGAVMVGRGPRRRSGNGQDEAEAQGDQQGQDAMKQAGRRGGDLGGKAHVGSNRQDRRTA